MQKPRRRAGWNYSWTTFGFSCIIFWLHYPSALLKPFLLSQPALLCRPSLWGAVTLSEGSWLCPSAVWSALSGHVPLWAARPLGSGFPPSSCASGSRARTRCKHQEQGQGEHDVIFYHLAVPKLRSLPPLSYRWYCITCVIHLLSHWFTCFTQPNVASYMSTHLHCSEKCR